ncbi:MAG TPA: Lrp/AsnC family transcriptional regulator [Rhodospirillales bacterium]|nr:Lrp/AsnC family transcriptional regulator [Rhodospirillales bacterium]
MNELEKRLLDGFQRGFPLTERPFAEIARQLNAEEDQVIGALEGLSESGIISRVGAAFAPGGIGASTLAALAAPPERLEEIAELVNGFEEVNHNYEREHRLNLWFVITAPDRDGVDRVIAEISRRSGLEVLDLPMLESYRLNLGFDLQWS